MEKKLYKSRTDVKLDGVCAGIAKYLGVDITLVRILWVIFALGGGSGVIAYIICAVLMPREPEVIDYTNQSQDGREN